MGREKAREGEIEITPEMIEAGLLELYRFSKHIDEVECLKRIFRAMVLASDREESSNQSS